MMESKSRRGTIGGLVWEGGAVEDKKIYKGELRIQKPGTEPVERENVALVEWSTTDQKERYVVS